eukprot:scaffold5169_cov172-Amphora_coffeaeformis.AAC.5
MEYHPATMPLSNADADAAFGKGGYTIQEKFPVNKARRSPSISCVWSRVRQCKSFELAGHLIVTTTSTRYHFTIVAAYVWYAALMAKEIRHDKEASIWRKRPPLYTTDWFFKKRESDREGTTHRRRAQLLYYDNESATWKPKLTTDRTARATSEYVCTVRQQQEVDADRRLRRRSTACQYYVFLRGTNRTKRWAGRR